MINDTAASLNDVLFPSVAICNINQMQRSILDASGFLQSEDDYRTRLINYYMEGAPANNDTSKEKFLAMLSKLEKTYNWNRNTPLAPIASQNCSDMMMMIKWRLENGTMLTTYRYDTILTATDYGMCCRKISFKQTWFPAFQAIF
ncbi:uncharacterized protein LOC111712563 [Eurytemora carolleeae]|uniref:uncharacterized protein LOC111712563 n=1 Tax=Eurytemora carolleeae TaxID=1294199 RepID=UPI000C775AE3|nr:uncharacterized protein LOC111712563 [Eurytemora carolleeae]|eukprot:XP_023342983.1 uncharacterized protein LOC111712563 [Eurytemora affinis]